jgi:hypothetical protein
MNHEGKESKFVFFFKEDTNLELTLMKMILLILWKDEDTCLIHFIW